MPVLTHARCAISAIEEGLDPIGTAGSYEGYLFVPWPLPWPRDPGELPELAGAVAAAKARRWRLQLVVPEGGDGAVLIAYERPAGAGFRQFVVRRAGAVERAGVAEAAVSVLEGPSAGDAFPPGDQAAVFVCTHGRRDRCCGNFGTRLHNELVAGGRPGERRLWRTSHSGGHRFAPTAIVLPEATSWAFMTEPELVAVAERRGDAAAMVGKYRGCGGLPSPQAQVLERAALAEVGWSLLDATRTVEELGEGRLRLTARWSDQHAAWEGTVGAGRTVLLPTCGGPAGVLDQASAEWRLTDVSRVA